MLDLRSLADTTTYQSAKLNVMVEGAALCLTAVGRKPGESIGVFDSQGCTLPHVDNHKVQFKIQNDNGHWIAKERAEQLGLCIALRYVRSVCGKLVGRVPVKPREFDYYLHSLDSPLDLIGCLEVSGIERGKTPTLRKRVKSKVQRIVDKGADDMDWIVIVAMAEPFEMSVIERP
ncbi:MAG: hypothetical protein BGO89_13650 [Candidatus Kapaibacterium thiocyanatum]|uniref:Uncharacterized protein n=1 Tax=Candidatus Kapaibacterium thiocyanatum TaxID=1895771 RepID=A0A1M3KVG6_9BACT|nr:MAG: hypothetical protein BGO89_13650 ['Candidatus Kapabacteria' thiocyanatum]